MAQVFLSIGSNQNREFYISQSLNALAQAFGDLQVSSVYESAAVGFEGDSFYNLVVGIQTDTPVGELSRQLKQIEDDNGRVRQGPKFSGRTLDIDILTYDQLVGDVEGVALPRDEITYHAFVLWPLAELAPQGVHPELGETYANLWDAFKTTEKGQKQQLSTVDFEWQGQKISSAP